MAPVARFNPIRSSHVRRCALSRPLRVAVLCCVLLASRHVVARPIGELAGWTAAMPSAAQASPHPAVVRIVVDERGRSQSLGSGTLVDVRDDCAIVMTNWHVVRDAHAKVTVHFPDGFTSLARIRKVDEDWDLAALVVWRPNVVPVPLATQPPRPGDLLTIAGYGSGNYRAATGRCVQYVSPGIRFPAEMVELSAEARQGDSGGPIFNDRGELAGVLFGASRGSTTGTVSGRVRKFLASVTGPSQQSGASLGLAGQPLRGGAAMTNPSVQSGLRGGQPFAGGLSGAASSAGSASGAGPGGNIGGVGGGPLAYGSGLGQLAPLPDFSRPGNPPPGTSVAMTPIPVPGATLESPYSSSNSAARVANLGRLPLAPVITGGDDEPLLRPSWSSRPFPVDPAREARNAAGQAAAGSGPGT
ncbi:MAG TPA: serine protease, partial [Pirellulaceae bacterium]|nr:serine protease [Pirellulaceae bacterium]